MATQTRHNFILSSANATPVRRSLKITGMAVQSDSAHKVADSTKGLQQSSSPICAATHLPDDPQGVPPPAIFHPSTPLTPPPTDLTEFQNTNLIHEKRLKVNNSQLAKVTSEFSELKARYLTTLTIPPTTTAAFRSHILSRLQTLCTRHGGLLNVRRGMLERQQRWLEEAMDVQIVRDSHRLLMAIDMQIEAAKDMVLRQNQRALMQELTSV